MLTHFMAQPAVVPALSDCGFPWVSAGRLSPAPAESEPAALIVDGHQDDLGLGHLDRLAWPVRAGAAGGEPHRSASTDTRTVTDVRPTRTVSV